MELYKKIVSVVLSVTSAFFGFFGIYIGKPEVDMDKFEIVIDEEFEGDSLNSEYWAPLYISEGSTLERKGGYWNADMISLKDGNLHISTKYFPDGYEGNGLPGWYSAAISSKGLFEQAYGYFEIRCILPKGFGVWSAFWLNCEGMKKVDGTGIDGAEIDIFESPRYFLPMISTNVHIDGYEEDLKSKNIGNFTVAGSNPYEEYNTYGLEWNKDEYIFYINGKETSRSDFGYASRVPEYLIASVEVGGSDGVPGFSWAGLPASMNSDGVTDFIIDYIKVYQYKDAQ